MIHRDWTGFEPFDVSQAEGLVDRVGPDDLQRYEDTIARYEERGIRVITVLDEDYPTDLRQVYNRPPFLFARGKLRDRDNRAVAIVGTRQASAAGLDQARRLSEELARNEVTVLSGLAGGRGAAVHLQREGVTPVLGPGSRRVACFGEARGSSAGGIQLRGEIGPVGGKNFLHRFTASIALFVDA